MNHIAPDFSASTHLKTHRDMRIDAYNAIEQSRLRGGTEAEQILREADLTTAESIAWEIYGDASDATPHETRLLISSVFFEKGDLDNALHYANRAIENEASHTASVTFKATIEEAIQNQKPVISEAPTIIEAPTDSISDVEKPTDSYRRSFNHPLPNLARNNHDDWAPYVNEPEEDENGITTFPGNGDRWDDMDALMEERAPSINLG